MKEVRVMCRTLCVLGCGGHSPSGAWMNAVPTMQRPVYLALGMGIFGLAQCFGPLPGLWCHCCVNDQDNLVLGPSCWLLCSIFFSLWLCWVM